VCFESQLTFVDISKSQSKCVEPQNALFAL